jgi:hypothetical protein
MSSDPANRKDADDTAAKTLAVYQGFGCVGCGSVVLIIFSMLAYTVWRADTLFLSDPEAVVATLQQIVPSEVPEGYRGLQGTDSSELKIAILGPASYEGKVLKVDVPLLISAWSWPAGSDADEAKHKDAIVAFWKGRVLQRLGEVKEFRSVEGALELDIRGQTLLAAQNEIVCESQTLRAVTVMLPSAPGKGPTAISFLGLQGEFDEKGMRAFVSSIR